MFEVTMLPASEGDCFVIRYGDPHALRVVLIDAGRKATFKKLLDFLPEGKRSLELFVISHIDRDHIEGAIHVLGREDEGFTFQDIWFNGYRHLDWQPDIEEFGAVQGEALTKLLLERRLPWNKAFDGGPVRLDQGQPVVRTLAGGLKLTILSPGAEQLLALEPTWEKECREAGLVPTTEAALPAPEETDEIESFGGSLEDMAATKTKEDTAAPNGSSIAFLAEYDGVRAFFGADAYPSVLVRSLEKLAEPRPIECALVKVSHHGSRANTSRQLLDQLSSDRFFISTNGSYFNHPDDVAIARILTPAGDRMKTLFFNYEQDKTRPWNESSSQKQKYNYRCEFPAGADQPLTLVLAD